MRIPRLVSLLLALPLVAATAPAVASSQQAPLERPTVAQHQTVTQHRTGDAGPTIPTLVDIRAAHHPGKDRVVFEFDGGLPTTRRVSYVNQLIGDGSGLRIPIAGRAILRVVMSPANAHDDRGRQTVPARRAYALPNVITTVRAGDFEAVTTYGIGLAKRTGYKVFTLRKPDRLVIDINAGFTTRYHRVYFFNQKRYLDNTEPFFTPRWRRVLPFTPATGTMDRLFAGPVPGERMQGLRFLSSGATGFKNLSVRYGVARIQLTGGCSSGGSTVSIAGQIMPTLRQFPTVRWVKIYDPSGRTARPTGPSDSIPECLEP